MTYHVLLYPNITWQRDLNRDSYIVVAGQMIKHLNTIRTDLTFTAPVPEFTPLLHYPNVKQVRYPLPSYPNTMRLHFDTQRLLDIIDWKHQSVDVVFSHLPEHTLQIRNLFDNATNEAPPIVGYTHWSELPEITKYNATVLDVNILGLAAMLRCGINTEAQKQLILTAAATHFNPETVEHVNQILTPMHLGAETPDYTPALTRNRTIVFNHRPQTYKGFPEFLQAMEKLRTIRDDFDVWVPLLEKSPHKWITTGRNTTRHEYLSNLSACHTGIGMSQKYAGWSVAATDGMSVGVPYLLYDEPSYRELAGDDPWLFTTETELINHLNETLTDNDLWQQRSDRALQRFQELAWPQRIQPVSDLIDEAIHAIPTVGPKSKALPKLHNLITETPINKRDLIKQMRWGVGIPWTPYRNTLRSEGIEVSKTTYKRGKSRR